MIDEKSRTNLKGVRIELVNVVDLAAKNSPVPFMVVEGVRTQARQAELVKIGASTTMNSRHLTGHAVDLVGLVKGKPSWDWPLSYEVARAVRLAAETLGVRVVWGGIWDRMLHEVSDDLEHGTALYVQRRRKLYPGKRVFIDGPHFELDRKTYP